MMPSAPRSTQISVAESRSIATTTVQSQEQRSNSSSSLQAFPTDQVTSTSAPSLFTQSHSPSKTNINDGNQSETISPERLHLSLLKTALDGFFDSILVIHPNGQILQANGQAHRLFANAIPLTLQPRTSAIQSHLRIAEVTIPHPFQPLLDEIWRVSTAMVDSQAEFPNQNITLDSEVMCDGEAFRIRVRWMDLVIQHQSCLLVTIEDLQQTAVNQVNVDRWKYKLTPREAEVWGLKRQGYSYKAIATTLFVSENTVKKHLKNIQAKRRERNGVDA